MRRRLAQQRMTLSDLEWRFHASRAISAADELLGFPNELFYKAYATNTVKFNSNYWYASVGWLPLLSTRPGE